MQKSNKKCMHRQLKPDAIRFCCPPQNKQKKNENVFKVQLNVHSQNDSVEISQTNSN